MRNARPVQTFSAIVGKVDVNPYVAVPTQVLRQLREQAGKRSGPIPVTGKLQGKPFKATVVKFRGVCPVG